MRRLVLLMLLAGCGGRDPSAELMKMDPNADAGGMARGDGGGGGEDGGVVSPTCMSGEVYCDGASIRQCGADGQRAHGSVIASCGGEMVRTTCGACPAGPACVSPTPICSGTTMVPGGSASTFSTSGCGETVCTTQASAGGVRVDVAVGAEHWVLSFSTSQIPSGGTVALNGSGAGGLTVQRADGSSCANAQPGDFFPSAGYIRATYNLLAAGEPFELEMGGDVACGLRKEWLTTSIHVNGLIEQVR